MGPHFHGRSMAEFGEGLRSERERRGMSLEAICAETKVSERHLAALEREDYKALPSGVFRRGIVRAYLRSLGLDEQVWMPQFEASYGAKMGSGIHSGPDEAAWVTFALNVKKNRGAQRRSDTARWLGVGMLGLLVVAAGWAVWHYILHSKVVW